MKALLLTLMFFGSYAQAGVLVDCMATEIYNSPLEESFSVEEYPEVLISEEQAYIGSSGFSVADGAFITNSSSALETRVTVTHESGEESYEVVIDKKTGQGAMFLHLAQDRDSSLMATLVCK